MCFIITFSRALITRCHNNNLLRMKCVVIDFPRKILSILTTVMRPAVTVWIQLAHLACLTTDGTLPPLSSSQRPNLGKANFQGTVCARCGIYARFVFHDQSSFVFSIHSEIGSEIAVSLACTNDDDVCRYNNYLRVLFAQSNDTINIIFLSSALHRIFIKLMKIKSRGCHSL